MRNNIDQLSLDSDTQAQLVKLTDTVNDLIAAHNRSTELKEELDIEVKEAVLNKLQEILNAGIVAKKIGKYPTGEDKYQYSPNNEKIGAALREEFLRLTGEQVANKEELKTPKEQA